MAKSNRKHKGKGPSGAPNRVRNIDARRKVADLIRSGNARADLEDYDGAITYDERAIGVSADHEIVLARRDQQNIAMAYGMRGDTKFKGDRDYDGAIADYDSAI
jgi:tetratricopeptide (TPR) repeat protein